MLMACCVHNSKGRGEERQSSRAEAGGQPKSSSQAVRDGCAPVRLPSMRGTLLLPQSARRVALWQTRYLTDLGLVESKTQLLQAEAQVEAAKFRGVRYCKRCDKFQACLTAHGRTYYLGRFLSARQAAEAYDDKVRHVCAADRLRLRKTLNFPSEDEASFTCSPMQMRQRALKLFGDNTRKEASAFQLMEASLAASSFAESYKMLRLSGSSKADALLVPKGYGDAGLPIQLKAATSLGRLGRKYVFNKLLGYGGMLVLMVALDGHHVWASAGQDLLCEQLRITVGFESDSKRRVLDIASHLDDCFHDVGRFPHLSTQEATFQCPSTYKTEATAHLRLAQFFKSAGMHLSRCPVHNTAIDSVLTLGQSGSTPIIRVQEKASHARPRNGVYAASMWRAGGALGRLPYTHDDFDLLAACVLRDSQVEGVFLIPMSVLARHGFVGRKANLMTLYPTWRQPGQKRSKLKYCWQADFFFDIRALQNSEQLPKVLSARLSDILSIVLQNRVEAAPEIAS